MKDILVGKKNRQERSRTNKNNYKGKMKRTRSILNINYQRINENHSKYTCSDFFNILLLNVS